MTSSVLRISAVLLLCSRPLLAAAQTEVPRLRSTDPDIALVIAHADERSLIFHKLVTDLARTDGLIYVMAGRCGHGVRACVPHTITRAGKFRLLRLVIDPYDAEASGEERLAGTIAHELHHALELLSDPAVTSAAAMFMFYGREAPRRGAFETKEAGAVGDRVWREMIRWRDRNRSAEDGGMLALDPTGADPPSEQTFRVSAYPSECR